jgi:adenylate cyclase, class 2
MNIRNIEFKARTKSVDILERKLKTLNPIYKGMDHQVDTYFNVNRGRLKLREGNIENALIHYERGDSASQKQSDVILYRHDPDKSLKDILTLHLGIKAVVDKQRKIYFIENVKFHFDVVKGLGTFLEVEAIDQDGSFGVDTLKQQCDRYFRFFGLTESDLVDVSYSDMIVNLRISPY